MALNGVLKKKSQVIIRDNIKTQWNGSWIQKVEKYIQEVTANENQYKPGYLANFETHGI